MTDGGSSTRDRLLAELTAARAAFVAALADVEPDLFTAPGLLEDWSARDLVEHVAFWSDHGANALGLAASGRGAEFDYDSARTDAMNAEILARAASLTPAQVRDHEQAAFGRFQDALGRLDPALLELALGNGDTVESVIRYDGPDHYAEHTAHLRAWFTGEPEPDDEADA
jgi:uncharacterized protein (TIGR03083 family)